MTTPRKIQRSQFRLSHRIRPFPLEEHASKSCASKRISRTVTRRRRCGNFTEAVSNEASRARRVFRPSNRRQRVPARQFWTSEVETATTIKSLLRSMRTTTVRTTVTPLEAAVEERCVERPMWVACSPSRLAVIDAPMFGFARRDPRMKTPGSQLLRAGCRQ